MIGGSALETGYGSSGDVTVTGGTLDAGYGRAAMQIIGNGDVTISGGAFGGGPASGAVVGLDVGGSGNVTVSGGTFDGGTFDGGFGMAVGEVGGAVTITGGTFTGYDALFASSSGNVTITGGTFTGTGGSQPNGLSVGSFVTVAGGTFTAGPGGHGLTAYKYGTLDLFGAGFSYTVNGVTTQITSGDLPTDPNNGVSGTLSGTLLNGQTLNATTFANSGTIEFNVGTPPALPAPEPSQSAALGLGVLDLSVLTMKARKRRAA